MLGAGLSICAIVATPGPAQAQAPDDDVTARARTAFLRGVQRSKDAQWGEALASFQEAAAVRDAPVVEYNIGFCERALGNYVAARRTFRRVLTNPEGLAPSQVEDSKSYVGELDLLVVRVAVAIDPPGASLVVDGRPLRADAAAGEAVFVAASGGAPTKAPDGKAFTVELDPGVHLFRASRPGHQDAFVQKTYRPGEKVTLELHLDLLPAHVAVSSDPGQAVVRVDNREAGVAPIDIERPPGLYRIEVVRDGFETYGATFDLHAGQRADLTAKLVPVRASIVKKWWFWTAAAVVVAGGVVLTYELTKPPPPYDGGSLKWVAKPTALRW
jgi:hypothetical protein